jgi:antagonist of KipI
VALSEVAMASPPSIEVLSAGLLTTVQDLGRLGYGELGVSPGGAADTVALRLANRLLGNDAGAPALELTLSGPRLRFRGHSAIAVTGADLAATIEGRPLPMNTRVTVEDFAELRFGGGRRGARAYVAVAGGFDVPLVLGSAATDLRGGFGGCGGRALRAGDVLRSGAQRGAPQVFDRRAAAELAERRSTLRVLAGAHHDLFTPESMAALVGESFAVSDDSDRMGVRLRGAQLHLRRPRELVSEGVAPGAIQVPPNGDPIVLGVDHPATGGYPQIASVIAADLPSLAQLRPRDAVRFAWTTVPEARAALAAVERHFKSGVRS